MADDNDLQLTDDEQWRRDSARQRLEIMDALAAALDRRVEVMEVITSSPSAEDAKTRLVELLNVSEICATAVLDLQWRRFAQMERNRIVEERDLMRREIG